LTLTRYVGLVFPIAFAICLLIQSIQVRTGYLRAAIMVACVSVPTLAVLAAWVTQSSSNYQTEGHVALALNAYRPAAQPAEVRAASETASNETASNAPARAAYGVRWALLFDGVRVRLSDLSRLLVPGMWRAPSIDIGWWHLGLAIIFLVVAGIFLGGWWQLVRQRLDVFVFAAPLWAVVYMHSSTEVYGRVFNPLLPVLFLCVWQGLRTVWKPRVVAAVMGVMLVGNLAQSIGYWLVIDRPRAVLAHNQWPVVDQMAEFLRQHPQPVGISDHVSQPVWSMLELAIDRGVQHPLTNRLETSPPRWYVTLSADTNDNNEETALSAGNYSVLARGTTAVAQAPHENH